MNLNIDPEWLKEMAEKEGGGILSVGGLVTRIQQGEEVTVTVETVGQAEELGARQARGEILITDVQFAGAVPGEVPTSTLTITVTEPSPPETPGGVG